MLRIAGIAGLLLGALAVGVGAGAQETRTKDQVGAAPGDQAAGAPVGARGQLLVVDNGGRAVESLEVGSSLFVSARGLEPNRIFEFRVGLDRDVPPSQREAVSFARAGSNARGEIPPLVLWYQSGVSGC